MATTVGCDFEATGPAGSVLTNGNTGGTVTIGAGATAVSTTDAAGGLLAGEFDVPAANVSSRVTTAVTGGTLQFACSVKFKIDTPGFATTSKRFVIVQNTAFGTVCSLNYNGGTNRVQLQNAAGGGTVTITNTLALDVWYRVELVLTVATAATGVYSLNLYLNQDTTPINAVPFTGSAYDLGTLAVGGIQHGINTNGTAVAAKVKIDSVRYDPVGTVEIGPDTGSVSASSTAGLTAAGVVGTSSVVTAQTIAALTSTGTVGKLGQASSSTAPTLTTAGAVGKAGVSTLTAVAGLTAAGTVSAGPVAPTVGRLTGTRVRPGGPSSAVVAAGGPQRAAVPVAGPRQLL